MSIDEMLRKLTPEERQKVLRTLKTMDPPVVEFVPEEIMRKKFPGALEAWAYGFARYQGFYIDEFHRLRARCKHNDKEQDPIWKGWIQA